MERALESVWDYPRPPIVVDDDRRVLVARDGILVAASTRTVRVLETSHPPVFYLPMDDVDKRLLEPNPFRTFCEFKGTAHYWDVITGERVESAAWIYPQPAAGYQRLAGCIAFYATRLRCTVDGELVSPQPGGFYGGWITPEIVGPFKGEPGSGRW